MKQAIVVKLYGDPETSQAIADGIIRIETVTADEMAVVQRELEQLRAERDMHRRYQSKHYDTMVEMVNAKYPIRHTPTAIRALMAIITLPYLLLVTLKRKTVEFVTGAWL